MTENAPMHTGKKKVAQVVCDDRNCPVCAKILARLDRALDVWLKVLTNE